MTSPEVDVGSIVARVALDTTGLKKGEAESTAAFKRTATGMSQTAQSADRVQKKVNEASTAIKRNTDVQVDAIRRQTAERTRAERQGGAGSRAAGGAVAGVVAGQLLRSALDQVGDGKGTRRDAVAGLIGAGTAGGAIGSLAGPEGAAIGALGGGGLYGVTHINQLATSGAQRRERAEQIAQEAAWAEQDKRTTDIIQRQAKFTDELGRAQLRQRDAVLKLAAAKANLTSTDARSREANIVAPLLGGIFDEHQRMTQGDVGKAVDKLTTANDRLQKAQDRVDKLRAGSGRASQSSLLSAESSVESARAAAAKGAPGSALRLQAAEERLAELRRRGGTNTRALAAAERDLETARKKADAAQAGATKAGLPAALDVKTLLGRQAAKSADVQALDRDTRTLVAKGVRAPVIEELLRVEKEAPGTVHKVASSITHAQVVAFNQQQVRMDKAAADLIRAPLDRAAADAARDAEKNARLVAEATRRAYAAAFGAGAPSPNLPNPVLLPGGKPAPKKDPLTTTLFPDPATAYTPRSDPDTRRNGTTLVKQTVYSMPNATIVAPDPAALARELQARSRITGAGGVT